MRVPTILARAATPRSARIYPNLDRRDNDAYAPNALRFLLRETFAVLWVAALLALGALAFWYLPFALFLLLLIVFLLAVIAVRVGRA
jgi:small-conductance mechanosensitive channel